MRLLGQLVQAIHDKLLIGEKSQVNTDEMAWEMERKEGARVEMRISAELERVRKEETTYLEVIPVLHRHNVHLVDDEDLDGGEEVGVASEIRGKGRRRERRRGVREKKKRVEDESVRKRRLKTKSSNLLLLLNTRPQSQRTGDNHVRRVELGIKLDRLPRDLESHPKAIINVALERVDMILGIVLGVLL